jgi:2-enoate reductase
MQSEKYKLIPAKKRKRVAIIGGGIGGMEAAIVCARRGHRVTIYEKANRLGGVFHAAAAPSFKEKDRALMDWYLRELDKYPITVRLKQIVEEIESITNMYDEVIVATGAVPNHLKVKGAKLGIEATDFLLGKKPVGQTVVVIGGGLTGCEIAYELYLQGKTPIIVEMKDDLIAAPGVCLANSSYLRDFFKANNVAVHLNTKLTQIHPDGVTVKTKDGSFRIDADSVILSVGYQPNPLAPRSSHIHHVGDCSKVGNLRSVIWQAWDVAMKI